MMDEAEVTKQISPKMERTAAQRARDRAKAAMWDLNVAVFLFAILALLIILLSQGIGIEVMAPVAVFGLAIGWLMGWRKGKRLYRRFYDEELSKLEQELKKETTNEKVRKALREWEQQ